MTPTMWMVMLWAAVLPLIGLATGQLRMQRDVFLLLIYLQSFIYVDVAPTFAASELNQAMQERYGWVQAWVLLLFQLPLLVLYRLYLRRRTRRYAPERHFHASPALLCLFLAGCIMLGVAYFLIAAKYGIIYRRVGEELSSVQLSMSVVEFGLYRTFIELGPFLLAALMLILRAPSDISVAFRTAARVGLVLITVLFLGYAIVNTRLYAVITLITLYGISNVMSRTGKSLSVNRIASIALLAFTAFYMVKVVENVRLSYANGENLLAFENFLPLSSHTERDDALRWRLNGVDLIAIIADNVETQGAAHGRAWAIPFVLSLDPIVRSPFTVQAKEAGLTTSKTLLMLQYGGIAKLDYYSCMLTDAYGNFSIAGFLLVAIVLAVLVAWSTAALRGGTSGAALLVGAFALTRLLPFEQEFGAVLFGWLKLVPFVALVIIFFPLRRGARAANSIPLERPIPFADTPLLS